MNLLSKLRLPYTEDVSFQILCFTVFFVPLVFYVGAYEQFEIIKIVLWSLCLSAELFYIATNRHKIQTHKILGALFAFFLFWLCISAIPAANIVYAIFGSSLRYIGVILFTILILFTLILSSEIRGDKRKIIFLFKLLCIDALLISILGIIQAYGIAYYTGMDTVGAVLRGTSFTGNADYTGIFLALIMPLNFFLFFSEKSKTFKYIWAIVLFVNIFGLVMAGSRAALVAVSVEAVIMLIIGLIKRSKIVAIVSVLAISIVVILSTLFLPVYRNVISDTTSVNTRIAVWYDAAVSITKHPMFGVGPGQVFFTIPGDAHNYFDDVHNLFLQIGVIGGVPLLACLLAIFLYIFYADWKVIISKHTDDDIKTLTTYLLLAEIGFAVVVCFSPIPSSAWLIFAVLIASQLAVLTDDKAWLQIKLYKWPLYILGALLIVYAATFLASEIILYQGMYDMQNGPTNHIKARNYARISSYLYPGEYMSSYNYIQQNIYLNGKARAEDSRRQIASYIKSYSSVPAAKWKISDLYDALYSETNNDADLESLIYYRTDELKSNPSASNIALSLAIIYNDNGGTHQAKEVIHNALESPGIDNPRILWTFLAKLEEEDGSNSTTVIADLRTAYLLDTTNIQLKHILVSSRKNPAVAISYVRGVY